MTYELSVMSWALTPLMDKIGEKKFMEIGEKLYEEGDFEEIGNGNYTMNEHDLQHSLLRRFINRVRLWWAAQGW